MQAAAVSTFMLDFFFLTSVSPCYLNDESISPHSLVRTRSTVIPLTPLGNAPCCFSLPGPGPPHCQVSLSHHGVWLTLTPTPQAQQSLCFLYSISTLQWVRLLNTV